MKKPLLLAGLLFGTFLTANAQETVLLSQDFEGTGQEIFDAGWGGIDFDGDGSSFGVYTSATQITDLGFTGQVAGSGNFTVSNGQATPAPDTDNAYISPEVEIPAGTSALFTVKMASFPIEQGATSPYSIYVLTATELESIADATALRTALDAKTPNASGSAAASATDVNVDLTSFAGQSVTIVFRQFNTADTGAAYLFLDDARFRTGVTASVNNALASKFSVYPNPATNVVNVGGTGALVNNVSIIDINGRTVKTAKFNGVANAEVDVADLSAGVYMMTVASDKGSVTKKIVKN